MSHSVRTGKYSKHILLEGAKRSSESQPRLLVQGCSLHLTLLKYKRTPRLAHSESGASLFHNEISSRQGSIFNSEKQNDRAARILKSELRCSHAWFFLYFIGCALITWIFQLLEVDVSTNMLPLRATHCSKEPCYSKILDPHHSDSKGCIFIWQWT